MVDFFFVDVAVTIGSLIFAFYERHRRIQADKKQEELRAEAKKMYEELRKYATEEAKRWALLFG